MKKIILLFSFILCGIITTAQEANMDYYIHLKITPNTTLYFTIYCFEDDTPIYIVNGDKDTTMYFPKLYLDKKSAKQFFNKKSVDLQVFKIANVKNESVDFYIYGDVAYFRCQEQSNVQSINIKHNPILEWLSVQDTPISSLDVSNNPNLKVLLLCSNNLTSLNLSNNPKLKLLAVHGNPWTTEMLDQIMCSLTDRTGKGDTIDTQSPDDIGKGQLELISSPNDKNYNKFMQTNLANAINKNWVLVDYKLTEMPLQTNGDYDCSSGTEYVAEAMDLNVFPNPASDILNISCNEIIKSVNLINILGQEVYHQKGNQPNAQINTSKLTSGNYILKIETLENIITKSIIIN